MSGGAEIRVFSPTGKLYAAPNLIFHYVEAHDYLPPQEFMDALFAGPLPPNNIYFEHLKNIELEWTDTTPFTIATRIISPYS